MSRYDAGFVQARSYIIDIDMMIYRSITISEDKRTKELRQLIHFSALMPCRNLPSFAAAFSNYNIYEYNNILQIFK